MTNPPDRDLELGFFGANVGGMASPNSGEVAALAESLGYRSLWVAEHVVLPKPRAERPPLDPDWPMADPLLSLAYLTACTNNIQLCTGVLVGTQRHPVRLAKEAATLDVLSGGRFVLGMGVGHIDLEFAVLGVPKKDLRARFREHVRAMLTLWNDESPEFSGNYVSFSGLDAFPRPRTPGGPPLVMGGYAPAALEDAARWAAGWYGFGLPPEEAGAFVTDLRRRVQDAGRDPQHFRVSITPRVRLSPQIVQDYRAAGVDQLVISTESRDLDGVRRRLELNAPARLGITA